MFFFSFVRLHQLQRQRKGVARGLLAHGGAVAGEVACFSAGVAVGAAPAKADGAHRLHGAAGGTLCKGGSYRSTADTVRPGWRDEVPLYTAQGPSRPADLGLRLVLAGLNIPNAQRLQTLKEENRHPQQQPAPLRKAEGPLHLQKDIPPLEALDAIAAIALDGLVDQGALFRRFDLPMA